MATYIFLTIFILTFYPTFSSPKPLLFPLKHSLSNTKFPTPHHLLLKSTSTRSAARFAKHQQQQQQVSLSLSPGTDYTLSFSLGDQTISLYMDTGSDVVWLPCSPFTCILCDDKPLPKNSPNSYFNLNSSSSAAAARAVTCQSRDCSAAHSHLSTSDLCAISRCPLDSIEMSECDDFQCPPFYYAYGDGSLVAKLYADELSVPSLKIQNFTFGCAHTTLAEPTGVAGFGRGLLSLPAQLANSSPELGNQFSYCLASHSFDQDRVRQTSPLILGRYSVDEFSPLEKLVYTPMLKNHKYPYFYTVGLEAISVGKRRVTAPLSLTQIDSKGNGGMVVDSGTTYTMLPAEFYKDVMSRFNHRVGRVFKRAGDVESRVGLSPCFYIDTLSVDVDRIVPPLTWHFGGNSSVIMPKKNYFYEFLDAKRKVGCVTLMNSGDLPDSGGGPAGLFGNYQQQGMEVVYDLEEMRVGFARRKCAALWDSLNR